MIEKAWQVLLIIGAVAVATLLGFAIFAPRTVQQYYVGKPAGGYGTPGYCVMKSIEWDQDEAAFCSDDIDKVIRVVRELNEVLRVSNGGK